MKMLNIGDIMSRVNNKGEEEKKRGMNCVSQFRACARLLYLTTLYCIRRGEKRVRHEI